MKNNENKEKSWWLKNWSNILFVVVLILFLIPSTRFQLQVYINQAFSFSPSIEDEDELEQLIDYQWKLTDQDGKQKNFSSSKGKIAVINYWASWCGPCVAEMPSLHLLYKQYKNEVDFYFIARDEPQAIDNFMLKNNYDFPVYYEISSPPQQMKSNQLPTTFLIDQQGNIRISKTGAADWNSNKINALMRQLLQKQ